MSKAEAAEPRVPRRGWGALTEHGAARRQLRRRRAHQPSGRRRAADLTSDRRVAPLPDLLQARRDEPHRAGGRCDGRDGDDALRRGCTGRGCQRLATGPCHQTQARPGSASSRRACCSRPRRPGLRRSWSRTRLPAADPRQKLLSARALRGVAERTSQTTRPLAANDDVSEKPEFDQASEPVRRRS